MLATPVDQHYHILELVSLNLLGLSEMLCILEIAECFAIVDILLLGACG